MSLATGAQGSLAAARAVHAFVASGWSPVTVPSGAQDSCQVFCVPVPSSSATVSEPSPGVVVAVGDEGLEAVVDPLGDFDLVVLVVLLVQSSHQACREGRYLQHRS